MPYPLDTTNPVLNLSNNLSYRFVACDKEAEAYVSALARLMKLKESSSSGKKVLVYVTDARAHYPGITFTENDLDPICCSLIASVNTHLFYFQVEKIARAVATDVINKGGALIHGGLCSFKGAGGILAGPGEIGKTTASSRLPAPWISYSDDATLVIPDGSGGYNAHPWPTWSRFYFGGPGGQWKVEENIPLLSLFFLKQSEKDLVEPLDKYQAKAMLIDTIEHVTRSNLSNVNERNTFVNRYIYSAENIAFSVPAYRLHVSLKGEFWKELEPLLPKAEAVGKTSHFKKALPEKDDREKLYFIYRGGSMNPTLFEPEMLTIEPYNDEKLKKGDIICYRLGTEKDGIVHRIASVRGAIIKTRGDNNDCTDHYTLDQSAVIGRVVTSTGKNKTRTIYGGHAGVLDMYLIRLCRKLKHFIKILLHNSYRYLADSGITRRLVPGKIVFKVVIFERHTTKYPKLVLSGRTVGTFDFRRKSWKIKRPYRLFVDEKKLPVIEYPSQSDL